MHDWLPFDLWTICRGYVGVSERTDVSLVVDMGLERLPEVRFLDWLVRPTWWASKDLVLFLHEVEFAQWSLERLPIDHMRDTFMDAFTAVVKGGRLAVAQLLRERFSWALTSGEQQHLFVAACRRGELGLIAWLADEVKATAKTQCGLFLDICKRGLVDVARWFVDSLGVNATINRVDLAFSYACENGHTALAMFLAERFTPELDPSHFAAACSAGFLDMAQWLMGYLGVTTIDASLVQKVCTAKHTHVADWLLGRFRPAWPRPRVLEMFKTACEAGSLATARWVWWRFAITAEEARCNDNHCFRWACSHGALDVVLWLADTFQLEADDIRVLRHAALRSACEKGHLDVAQWISLQVDLTHEDVPIWHRIPYHMHEWLSDVLGHSDFYVD